MYRMMPGASPMGSDGMRAGSGFRRPGSDADGRPGTGRDGRRSQRFYDGWTREQVCDYLNYVLSLVIEGALRIPGTMRRSIMGFLEGRDVGDIRPLLDELGTVVKPSSRSVPASAASGTPTVSAPVVPGAPVAPNKPSAANATAKSAEVPHRAPATQADCDAIEARIAELEGTRIALEDRVAELEAREKDLLDREAAVIAREEALTVREGQVIGMAKDLAMRTSVLVNMLDEAKA